MNPKQNISKFKLFILFALLSFIEVRCAPESKKQEVPRCSFPSTLKTIHTKGSALWKETKRQQAAEMERQNCLQEAIWLFHEIDEQHEHQDQLKENLRNILSFAPFTILSTALGGSTGSQLVKFENNIQAVFKTDIGTPPEFRWKVNYKMEVAAYELDNELSLSLVPMTVERELNGIVGSLQYFISNAESGTSVHTSANRYNDMKLFDFLICNADRVSGNFLYWPDQDRVIAIDHGAALASGTPDTASSVLPALSSERTRRGILSVTNEQLRTKLAAFMNERQLNLLIQRLQQLRLAAETR